MGDKGGGGREGGRGGREGRGGFQRSVLDPGLLKLHPNIPSRPLHPLIFAHSVVSIASNIFNIPIYQYIITSISMTSP